MSACGGATTTSRVCCCVMFGGCLGLLTFREDRPLMPLLFPMIAELSY